MTGGDAIFASKRFWWWFRKVSFSKVKKNYLIYLVIYGPGDQQWVSFTKIIIKTRTSSTTLQNIIMSARGYSQVTSL